MSSIGADDILQKMVSTYRALSAYEDEGFVERVEYPGTADEYRQKTTFSTLFKSPDFFRFEWTTHYGSPSKNEKCAIWCDGKGVYQNHPKSGVVQVPSLGNAIEEINSTDSQGVIHKVPFWLFTHNFGITESFELTGYDLVNQEIVLERQCHHLRRVQVTHITPQETELWISCNEGVLLKVCESTIHDDIRFDLWHEKKLSHDPQENELLVEAYRAANMKVVEQRIRQQPAMPDWKKRSLLMSGKPKPIIKITEYNKIAFDNDSPEAPFNQDANNRENTL